MALLETASILQSALQSVRTTWYMQMLQLLLKETMLDGQATRHWLVLGFDDSLGQ